MKRETPSKKERQKIPAAFSKEKNSQRIVSDVFLQKSKHYHFVSTHFKRILQLTLLKESSMRSIV